MKPVYREDYERAAAAAKKREANNPYLGGNDDAADILKEELKPPPFLIHGVLHPGSIAFLGGNPKIGKTYAALHMLASVGQGIPWFDFSTEPGPTRRDIPGVAQMDAATTSRGYL